jgi:deoxyribodipyrimidine photo-lyase
MIESLEDLNKQLKKKKSRLFYFYGKQDLIINRIIKNEDIDAVFINRDYTPYSIKRDIEIKKVCKREGVDFIVKEDYLLNPVGSVTTGSNKIYHKFTPYFNSAKKVKVDTPVRNSYTNYISGRVKIKGEYRKNIRGFYKENNKVIVRGGRIEGLKALRKVGKQKQYNKKRNDLMYVTTRLSAYNKFGCISIREVYNTFKTKLGARNDLIKQLYWRDFYYNVTYDQPHVLGTKGNRNFKKKYSKVPWLTWTKASSKQKKMFKAWCKGETGYPVVDAGMRQMNTTGFMHNRARLIVASFLAKLMMWHWQEGEKYFAQTLVDYDPCQNSGNWQWCSSSGVDSQPYFRIFNPWAQGERYDPKCEYIHKWVPELKDVPIEHIHKWDEYWEEYDVDYPEPIIDYEKARDLAKKRFKRAL